MTDFSIDRNPRGLDWLNHALQSHGTSAQVALITPGGEVSFNRTTNDDARNVPDSYGLARMQVNARTIAVPRKFGPDVDGSLARLSVCHGWSADNQNPHGPSVALLTTRRRHALGVPWADAPAAVGVHAPTGIAVAIAGVWQYLALGSVRQAFDLLETQVNDIGQAFHPEDVWLLVSPGAHATGFYLDEAGRELLVAADQRNAPFVPVATPVDVPGLYHGQPYGLDLTAMFVDYLERAGVPGHQVFTDWRNTVNPGQGLPSKRLADANGLPYHSSFYTIAVS